MTDIVVGVRLNADGSGLVGQLKLSKTELDNLGVAEKGAADAARDLSQASDQAAKSQARAAQGARQTSAATAELTKNVGLARAGWQQVGFQVQDVFASYASGSRLSVIFAQQSGQLASAIALIAQASEGSKGKLAGLATFLGGPWGIGIGVAVSVVSALAASFLNANKAADAAKAGASGLADAQSALGGIFDLTSGKIKSQNDLLILNARLMAINLRSEAAQAKASAQSTIQSSDDSSVLGTVSAFFARTGQNPFDRVSQLNARATEARSYLDAVGNARTEADRRAAGQKALKFSETADFSGLSITADQFRQAVIDQSAAVAKQAVADAIDKSLDSGKLADSLKRDDNRKPKKDNSAEKASREAERLAQFSLRAAEAVARINDEYNTAPRDIDRARQATAQLDIVIRDVNKRLETGKGLTAAQRDELNKVKASAQELKPIIQASLVRPLTDMLESQQRQIDLGALQVSGRRAEADALQLTYTLMDKVGAKSEEQLATELQKRGVTAAQIRQLYGNLEVLRQQTREMQKQQAIQQAFLGAINDQRENVRLTLESLRKDGPKAFGDFFKRSLDVVDRLFSEVVTEKLFGGLFRDLEDQVTGADKVSEAGEKMAEAVDAASEQIVTMGKAAATATAFMTGKSAPMQVGGGAGGLSIDISDLRSLANGELGGLASGIVAGDQPPYDMGDFGDIIVNGRRPRFGRKGGFMQGYEEVFENLKKGLKDVFTDIFGDRGLFGESLSKTLGKAAANGQIGGIAGAMTGSSTGGGIGGILGGAAGEKFLTKALGSFAGPLGAIAGGVLGGLVGGLFKKAKYGTAVVTGGSEQDVSVAGNNSARKQAAIGLASSLQETLASIAEEFGGSVGSFRTSLGVYKDNYRVSTTGYSGKLNFKGNTGETGKGLHDFGDDEAGALAFAVMDAITDGGIKGVSAAVQKALRSSPDMDKAIAEALKVRDVEQLLAGLAGELERQFRTFEDQAKERVRIATQYGFDVVAIEKKNAEDRAKLVDQILTDRVGSLQQMLADIKYGDLFEGSLADQRQALLAEIAKTRTAAEGGEEGAADKLAALSRQLIELSRDAYGTAGSEYASDRESSVSAAERIIQVENDRIRAAQDAAAKQTEELKTIADNSAQQTALLSQMVKEIQLFGKTFIIPDFSQLGSNVARMP